MTTPTDTLDHFRAWAKRLTLDNGKPFELEPFQEAFLKDFFSGYRESWLLVPEGNGKTTLLAALALYHVEHVPSAWVPVAASARDQAQILYRQAAGFVQRAKHLNNHFKCQ